MSSAPDSSRIRRQGGWERKNEEGVIENSFEGGCPTTWRGSLGGGVLWGSLGLPGGPWGDRRGREGLGKNSFKGGRPITWRGSLESLGPKKKEPLGPNSELPPPSPSRLEKVRIHGPL